NCLLRSESSSRETIFPLIPFPIRRELCVKRAKRRGKVPKGSGWNCRELNFLAAKCVVGLYPGFEPRCGHMKASETFHISRKPVVPLAETVKSPDLGNGLGLPRFHGSPRLLAIARDPRTIFAYWNVDWPLIFKNTVPVDRRVHLRVHCADGLEEKEAAIEPMAGMHFVTMSQRHRACRIEIGYYQPADVWHSVVMSKEIVIPLGEMSE